MWAGGGAAAIQLDTCSPNFLIQEYNGGELHQELFKEPIRFENGYIIPPPGRAGCRVGRSGCQETVIEQETTRRKVFDGKIGRKGCPGNGRAGRGHGEAVAIRFAEEGAAVAVCDILPVDELDSGIGARIRAVGGQALCCQTDVSQEEPVRQLVQQTIDRFGTIDILANVVGIAGPTKDVWQMSLAEWRQTLAVNLDSAFLGCKYALPEMIRKRYGRVINFSSGTGKQPLSHRSAVCHLENGRAWFHAHTGGRCGTVQHHGQRDLPRFSRGAGR